MYRIAICEDEPSMARENEAMICHILEGCHFRRRGPRRRQLQGGDRLSERHADGVGEVRAHSSHWRG